MPTTADEFRDRVTQLVRKHYEASPARPLLLSELGKEITREEIWPEDRAGRSLGQLLRAHAPEIQLIPDPQSPAYIAVASIDTVAHVKALVAQRQQSASSGFRLEDVARSVLLAFCISAPANTNVYVRRFHPFRYQLQPPPAELTSEYLVVEHEFRRPGLRVDRIDLISAADRADLEDRLSRWCAAHRVRIDQFFFTHRTQSTVQAEERSALERLIAAQPPDVAQRLLIPADIVQILIRHR